MKIRETSWLLIFFILLAGCNINNTDRISLNGTWKISLNPPEGYEKNDTDSRHWRDIQVPGGALMQGFAIRMDEPFVYKKEIGIPPEFEDKDIKINFEGVYSYSRLWVNGSFVRDHRGGFTPWEADITPYVTPGERAWITLEVTDEFTDVSYGSGYAKHPIGGILRDVYIKALPQSRIDSFIVETILDEEYRDAILLIDLSLLLQNDAQLTVSLTDPLGNSINLENNRVRLDATDDSRKLEFSILNPLKWDAEHPHLYTLQLELSQGEETVQKLVQKVGFREIEVVGNQMLVNGNLVKLRGANRHVVHPLLGRVDTPEYDLLDLELAKEANMNFIRTSHYPPSQRFADLADSLGIYLMVENAACFLGQRKSDMLPPDYAHIRDPSVFSLEPIESMVQAFRNNPSVVIWSVANESRFDEYFEKELEYVKATDPTRPAIFSHSGGVTPGLLDLWSRHYIRSFAPVEQFGREDMPVLHGEWLHIPAYNQQTLRTDLNVREFWGASLDTIWAKTYEAEGALGGAIWNMIDDSFMIPDTTSGFREWWGVLLPLGSDGYRSTTVGYGDWGFIDVWRRKKPEFWSVKKAYSPVRVHTTELEQIPANRNVELEVFNRFDNTNLNELTVKWEYEGSSGTVRGADIAPRQTGFQTIPGQGWRNGSNLTISFLNDDRLIDQYDIRIGEARSNVSFLAEGQGNVEIEEHRVADTRFEGAFFRGNIELVEELDAFFVKGDDFSIQFDGRTGLVKEGIYNGETILTGGPFLRLTQMGVTLGNRRTQWNYLTPGWESDWELNTLNKEVINGNYAEIAINGTYHDTLSVDFLLTINGNGDIKTSYSYVTSADRDLIEVGLTYKLSPDFDKLSWDREGYWPAYPEGHLSKTLGEEPLRNFVEENFRQAPQKDWVHDVKSFYYKGLDHPSYEYRLTNIVRSLKENIYHYTLTNSSGHGLSFISDGSLAGRIEQTDPDRLTLVINSLWDYPDIYWGAYMKNIKVPESYEDEVILIFNRSERSE